MIGHILSSEKLSLEGSAQSGVVPRWFGWSQLSKKEWESNKEEWSWSLLNWSPSPLISFLHFFTATNWHFDIFESKIAF